MVHDIELLKKMQERYMVDPIVFIKTIGLAKTSGELFDILEDMPKNFPIVWDDEKRRWVKALDLNCFEHERKLDDIN